MKRGQEEPDYRISGGQPAPVCWRMAVRVNGTAGTSIKNNTGATRGDGTDLLSESCRIRPVVPSAFAPVLVATRVGETAFCALSGLSYEAQALRRDLNPRPQSYNGVSPAFATKTTGSGTRVCETCFCSTIELRSASTPTGFEPATCSSARHSPNQGIVKNRPGRQEMTERSRLLYLLSYGPASLAARRDSNPHAARVDML